MILTMALLKMENTKAMTRKNSADSMLNIHTKKEISRLILEFLRMKES